MDEAGKKHTERTVTFIIGEDDFNVRASFDVTLSEIYTLCVSCIQHIEEMYEDSTGFSGASMLQ